MRASGASRTLRLLVTVFLVLTAFSGAGLAAKPPPKPAPTTYAIDVWFQWETAVLDVIVVPPEHGQILNGNGVLDGGQASEIGPCTNSYLDAVLDSIAEWNSAIATFGSSWLKAALTVNVYVLGCGPAPPASALQDPEIVIFSDPDKTVILGVAIHPTPVGGNRCLVDNSRFFITSFSYEDMYNVGGQEYGHCLGLDHVKDDKPAHDIMDGSNDDSIGAANGHLHCASNLDVKGLDGVFATALGQSGGGQSATIAISSYAC